MGCTDSKAPDTSPEAAKAPDAAKIPEQAEAGGPDMGCGSAKAVDSYEKVPTLELMSDEDRHRVRETWEEFGKANSESETGYGHLIFYSMFKDAPQSRFLFNFVSSVDEKDLVDNQKLRWHIGRVVDAITGTVFVLDDVTSAVALLEKLGGRHFSYGTKEEFFPALKKGVLYAMEKGLGDGFTKEKRESFDRFLTVVARSMVKGIQEVASGDKVADAVSLAV